MSRQTFAAPGARPAAGEPQVSQSVHALFVRAGLGPTGTVVPDLGAIEPGDVLLFAATGVGASQITDYQRACGHPPENAAFVHAAIFIAADRMAHARPAIPGIRPGGVRIESLLTYWTHQQLAILRARKLDPVQRQQVGLSAAAQTGLPYDQRAIHAAARYYVRHRSPLPPGWADLLVRETQPNAVNEALPTANTCAQLVVDAFSDVDPQLLRVAGRGPIVTPADLAAADHVLTDVNPPMVAF